MDSWNARTETLLGADAVARLAAARVLVAGVGGVGGYAAEMLARTGVGYLTLVDADDVALSNINRQLIATSETVGQPKVDLFARRFAAINPQVAVTARQEYINAADVPELLEPGFDYVVDAIDTLAPKIFLIYHSLQKGYRVVSSMGAGGKMDPEQIRIADISKSYNCNLARMLRKRLHKLGVYKGVKVVFSPEEVDPEAVVLSESENKKSNVGTISYMPPLFGCFCASVVIRDITNPI